MRSLDRREFLTRTARGALALGGAGLSGWPIRPASAATDELATLDALAQAELVRAGKLSPRELLEAAIARAEALNPRLNAIVTRMYEAARGRADGALPEGPFTGVPTLVKDLTPYDGVRLTLGCRFFKDNVADFTHPFAERMERGGFVVLGKSNTPEFGLLPTTESFLLGPASNPWNLAYSPGGSSGGSAAAVAAGIVPIAQASDGGGSIRVPASNCALFGMKATRGRFPEPGPKRRGGELAVRGFVSRSVRDGQAAFDLVALKAEEGSTLPPPVQSGTVEPRQLRIAFSTRDLRGRDAHPECAEAVRKTAALCESLGHAVEEGAPSLDGAAFNEHFLTFWAQGAAEVIDGVAAQLGGKPPRDAFEPWTWGLRDLFAKRPADAVAQADRYMLEVTRKLEAFHRQYDVWLTPVLGRPPLRTGEASQEQPFDELLEQLITYVSFTPLANATGQPAMSVPLHWTDDGLPVGSHFLARPGEEALLFALAEQLEAAQPWADRWPPVSIAQL